MRFILNIVIVLCYGLTALGQAYKTEKAEIIKVLDAQVSAWNEGNLEEFMQGYWKSDSLQFVGSEITKGWNATLERYKRTYPTRDAMGTLRFELIEFQFIGKQACLLTGKYFLKRKADAPNGIFTLILRKKEGRWVIVYDHTS